MTCISITGVVLKILEVMKMLMTVGDLERETKIKRPTWWAWIRQGRLTSIRLGRRVLVDQEDLERFLSQNRIPARGR